MRICNQAQRWGMEDSAERRVDVGEVEIDRGRGIVLAMRERERENWRRIGGRPSVGMEL